MYEITEVRFKSGPPALMLVYATDLPIIDNESLRTEVGHIWHTLRPLAESKGFEAAAIRASEPPDQEGSRAYTYVFGKHDDGSWREHDNTESLRDPVVETIVAGLLSGNHFSVVDALSYPPSMAGDELDEEKASLRRNLSIIEGRLGRFITLTPSTSESDQPLLTANVFTALGTGSTQRLLDNPPYPARIFNGSTDKHANVELRLNFTPHEANPRQLAFGLPSSPENVATLTQIGTDIMEGWSADRLSERE